MKNDTRVIQETPEQLFERHTDDVRKLVDAQCFKLPQHVDKEDLHVIALAAMWEMTRKYDQHVESSFWTFAAKRIRGSVIDELRRSDWMPRRMRRLSRQVAAKQAELGQQSGRRVDIREACNSLRVKEKHAQYLVRVQGVTFVSMQAEIGEDFSEFGETIPDTDMIDPAEALVQEEARCMAMECLDRLDAVTRSVVRSYFWTALPLRKMAADLGVTESRISQIYAKGMSRIKILSRAMAR